MADLSVRMDDVVKSLTLRLVVTSSAALRVRTALGVRLMLLGARLIGFNVDVSLDDRDENPAALSPEFRPLAGTPSTAPSGGFRHTRDLRRGCCCGHRSGS